MTMIESVAVRQRGSLDFDGYYDNLCALQSTCPLPAVKAHLTAKTLDLNGDRIRFNDWGPILGALKINKTLEVIAIRSYFQQTLEEQVIEVQGKKRRGHVLKRKLPAIRSKEITYRLCKVLKDCLSVSSALKTIQLQGLPLRSRDLATLGKGLMGNRSLKQLCLDYSRIGDEGLEILSKGIRNAPAIAMLDFTGCGLSHKGMEVIAYLIKHQAMKRHNEAWQDSLRYRRPELDRMDGIRRISMNRNNLIGDEGAKHLAEALKDDLWLKALDVQHCGISDIGAQCFLDVLKYNTCISILDVRNNPMIKADITRNMMDHLMINGNGQDNKYQWIQSEVLQDPTKVKQRKKRTKTLVSSFGRKTNIKVNSNSAQKKRPKNTVTPVRTIAPIQQGSSTPGIPWRTALRANRYKGYPPDDTPNRQQERSPPMFKVDYSYEDGDHMDRSTNNTQDSAKAVGFASESEEDDSALVNDPRSVRIEIERLRRRLKDETRARSQAEERVIELTVENNRLKQQIDDLQQNKQSILDDDRVLTSLEQSFKQFHSFLDLLKEAGLGQLITIAGIEQSSMPFSKANDGRLEYSFLNNNSKKQKVNGTTNGHHHIKTHQNQPPQIDPSYHHSAPELAVKPDGNTQRNNQQQKPIANTDETATGSKQHSSSHQAQRSSSDHAVDQRNDLRSRAAAFPQLYPQNYHTGSDPTLQTTVAGTGQSKSKSKFDELYQKVLEETEGALSDSLNKAEHPYSQYSHTQLQAYSQHKNNSHKPSNNGLYSDGNIGRGISLETAAIKKKQPSSRNGGDLSDRSEHSQKSAAGSGSGSMTGGDGSGGGKVSGRPLHIDDLHDISDLMVGNGEDLHSPHLHQLTSTDPVTQVKAVPSSTNGGQQATDEFHSPREIFTDRTTGKYSETFEKDDDDDDNISEISEEILEDFEHHNKSGENSDDGNF